MEIFQFKQFAIRNEKSSMKVNTDGVLLGAAMTLRPSDRFLLDIGTGTGVIALMAAQRLAEISAGGKEGEDGECALPICDKGFSIIAIDIDCGSAAEAAENFVMSPWASHLVARHISLSDFETESVCPRGAAASPCDAERECTTFRYNPSDKENLGERGYGGEIAEGKFDMIFSNPPYFESSLKSPDERKRAARHAETMSYREIIAFAARHLTSAGRLSMILPYETEREAVRYAASFGLRLFRRLRIRTTPSRPFSRVILEFTFGNPAITNDELTIQDPSAHSADNPAGYTPAYRSLVKNFLLI